MKYIALFVNYCLGEMVNVVGATKIKDSLS